MRARSAVSTLTLLAFPLLGCWGTDLGVDADDLVDFGDADVQVSGDVSKSFSGNAGFGTVINGGGFGIALIEESSENSVAILAESDERLGRGSHSLGDVESGLYAEVVLTVDGGDLFFISSSGEVQITSSSGDEVRGTLSFSAENEFGSGTIEVTGDFRAVCGAGSGVLFCN